jgi:PPOX class probable F420-dependent enzyme
MLSDRERRFLAERRVAHLATADARAVPHVVPVCFALYESTLYITIDAKPKRASGTALKRMQNILENPAVAVVVDRYDEDWTRLGWVMRAGGAEILDDGSEHDDAQASSGLPLPPAWPMQIAHLPSSPCASPVRELKLGNPTLSCLWGCPSYPPHPRARRSERGWTRLPACAGADKFPRADARPRQRHR